MTARLYVRPVGRLPSPALHQIALIVAKRPDLAFSAAEVVERVGASVTRRVVRAEEVSAALAGDAGRTLLERLQQSRTDFAGLALDRPRIMGIVNVTPDSFSDGGRYLAPDAAVAHALKLEAEGADLLDIGGESTRPGAEPVGVEEEWRRVEPVLSTLVKRTRVPLSIDTRHAEIMRRAVQAGARVINDVSALTHDSAGLAVAAASGLPVVLMHAQGDPRTMQANPAYDDVVLDVYDYLEARISVCEQAGIPRSRLIVDPGIGFGKTLVHNLALLQSLSILHGLGCAILIGASRKSFIAKLTGSPADDRVPGSLAAALLGVSQGVQIVRVHDVAATRQALAVWDGAQARSGQARP